MKINKVNCLIVSLLVSSGIQTQAIELVKRDEASVNLAGRFQMLADVEKLHDPGHNDERMYLFLKQARIIIDGKLEDYKFYTEWAMGGEEAVKNLNSSMSLLDFRADIPFSETSYLRLGQFKTPFGREAVTNDGSLVFTDRSINYIGSELGRDVGFAGVIQQKGFMGTLGIFTGGGRDNPERYLPEQLGIPLLVGRIGYDSAGKDPYNYTTSGVFGADEDSFSSFLNLAYMEDTRIGHSSVLNVKPSDRSLILNPNWNPYLAQAPLTRSRLWETSADFQRHFPIGDFNVTGEAEIVHSEFANEYGKINMSGGRVMGIAALNPFEVAVRYSTLYPSRDFAYKGTPITGSDSFQELTTSISYYHRPWSRFTLQAELEMNTPVSVEDGIGSYVLVEQPDQTTVVDGKGHIERQTVASLSFMYQLTF